MEVLGDEGDVLEWGTVSTPGVRGEESMKGMLVAVGNEIKSTRWVHHFLLEVQMKGSRGIAEKRLG